MAHPNQHQQQQQQNFYTNPAFCQKSEYYPNSPSPRAFSPPRVYPQRVLSPTTSPRRPPVGAQSTPKICDNDNEEYEQEFYEEMFVDDTTGVVQQKNFLVVSSSEGQQHHATSKPQVVATRTGARYTQVSQVEPSSNISTIAPRTRYEYIVPENSHGIHNKSQQVHRYAVIPNTDEEERYPVNQQKHNQQQQILQTKTSGRYALVPVEELKDKSRYETVTHNEIQSGRYEFIKEDGHSFIQEANEWHGTSPNVPRSAPRPITRSQSFVRQEKRQGNPIATQKLHELLQTPRKTPIKPQQTPQKNSQINHQMMLISPSKNLLTPSKNVRVYNNAPRAQQQLNYSIGSSRSVKGNQRTAATAVVAPICVSPAQSVYSETTYSAKSESWMNLSNKKAPVQGSLTAAAIMMILCGGVTTSLSFYMITIMGRLYFLDFGVISGFTCLLLGLMGFRTRNCYWLPNRNYISGYIVLSVFSLLTCAGLLVLLVMQPRPGTPLADMTSGAVCAISVLSLILAASGVIASYCCKVPPPDNRVEHCARGFTV